MRYIGLFLIIGALCSDSGLSYQMTEVQTELQSMKLKLEKILTLAKEAADSRSNTSISKLEIKRRTEAVQKTVQIAERTSTELKSLNMTEITDDAQHQARMAKIHELMSAIEENRSELEKIHVELAQDTSPNSVPAKQTETRSPASTAQTSE